MIVTPPASTTLSQIDYYIGDGTGAATRTFAAIETDPSYCTVSYIMSISPTPPATFITLYPTTRNVVVYTTD